MPRSRQNINNNLKDGFTLMELLTVIGVVAVLSLLTVPAFNQIIQKQEIRGEGQSLSSLLQKARMMANSTHKPIRAVINCKASCFFVAQAAQYDKGEVNEWLDLPQTRYTIPNSVLLQPVEPVGINPDGFTLPGTEKIYWAIFMPGGEVYSNPRPFDIFIHDNSVKNSSKEKVGLKLSVNNYSGRVALLRHEQ